MLNSTLLDHAIDIQARSYKLLKWLEKAVLEGFVPATDAHEFGNTGEAAIDWMKRHYHNLPENCRPAPDEISEFGRFFGTYLETSFDLLPNPETHYLTECGCLCPMCRRLSNPRQLKPKILTKQDKSRAGKLRLRRLEMLAREETLLVLPSAILSVATNPKLVRETSLAAYGASLLERLQAISGEPAVLALWRGFAWNSQGAPIRNFKLQTKDIIEAEHTLLAILKTHSL